MTITKWMQFVCNVNSMVDGGFTLEEAVKQSLIDFKL